MILDIVAAFVLAVCYLFAVVPAVGFLFSWNGRAYYGECLGLGLMVHTVIAGVCLVAWSLIWAAYRLFA